MTDSAASSIARAALTASSAARWNCSTAGPGSPDPPSSSRSSSCTGAHGAKSERVGPAHRRPTPGSGVPSADRQRPKTTWSAPSRRAASTTDVAGASRGAGSNDDTDRPGSSSSSSRRPSASSSLSVNGSSTTSSSPASVRSSVQRRHVGEVVGRVDVAVQRARRTHGAGRRRPARAAPARPGAPGSGAKPSSMVGQVLEVVLLPRLEPRVGDGVGQQAVGDHGIDAVAEQRQVGERPPGLGHDDPLGVHDQPGAW